jgi:hypothetical protein
MEHSDLPGHVPEQYQAERRALRAAESVLVAAGCKVVEVPASFDDGLDLFVALTRGRNVEPHMAAVQVKGGSSHRRRIPMKAHRAYWRDHTLPVFGVVHDGERGYWADLAEALKDDANLASVSTTQPLDASPEPPAPRRRRQGRVVTRPFPAAPAFPQVTSRSPARVCPSSAEVGPVFAIDGRCTKS